MLDQMADSKIFFFSKAMLMLMMMMTALFLSVC